MMTREEVIQFFKDNKKIQITFEKKDGSVREMICTRDLELIPEAAHPKTIKEIGEALPVFELATMGWRSFRFDSLLTDPEAV